MKLLYFAWVREQVGVGEETVDVPGDVSTVSDLMAWLGTRDDGYAAAFARADVIRAAVDQEHAGHDAAISDAREIAFFPPVTGG
ncbi:MAG: molybdopterin converting factor subunit 1 [Hyphomicrobiaceae bacterium]